jgi:threonine-phosphate decarboxylase
VFAMPGIRLGYLLTDNETYRERISSVGQPWSVSVLAECAGVAALSEQGYVERARRLVRDERSYLIKQLKKFNIEPIGSHANYLFFKLNKKIALKDLLYPKGILIRSCANYRGLDEQYYRIAVKKHHENEILIDALKMIFD